MRAWLPEIVRDYQSTIWNQLCSFARLLEKLDERALSGSCLATYPVHLPLGAQPIWEAIPHFSVGCVGALVFSHDAMGSLAIVIVVGIAIVAALSIVGLEHPPKGAVVSF